MSVEPSPTHLAIFLLVAVVLAVYLSCGLTERPSQPVPTHSLGLAELFSGDPDLHRRLLVPTKIEHVRFLLKIRNKIVLITI